MNALPKLIAVTGGIGAGKSVVSKILTAMGFDVFDCDSRARALMDADEQIKEHISRRISAGAIDGQGNIDRRRLAEIVFADEAKLVILNDIVHAAVKADLARWHQAKDAAKVVFVETAILYESGLNEIVDAQWHVVAPEEVRIQRVMARNGLSRNQVVARINAQKKSPDSDARRPAITYICNDGIVAVLPQVLGALKKIIDA